MSVPLSHRFPDSFAPRMEGAAARRSSLVRQIPCSSGFTLVEMVIVVALIGAMVLLATTRLDNWRDREAVRTAARTVAGAFNYARGEAIRTGNMHVVFFQQDIGGNALNDSAGNRVPILVLDDGRRGTANQNCQIDGGETTQAFRLERGVGFGPTSATAKVPADEGPQPMGPGWTFTDGAGGTASWVVFRPDGTPRPADGGCVLGDLGEGGGAIYLSNAERDGAVVLTPLGASRVYTWDEGPSAWK